MDDELLERIASLEAELRNVKMRLWVLDGKQTPEEILEHRRKPGAGIVPGKPTRSGRIAG